MYTSKGYSRRDFLKQVAASSAFAAGTATGFLSAAVIAIPRQEPGKPIAPSDKIRLATIGMGIIGFIDTWTALQAPGTEFVAAADLYDGRRARTNEAFGREVFTTRDYREILSRADVDAVIVSTPDHWHAKIAIEAMNAGKHVYCEKPMVQKLDDGHRVIEAQRKTKKVLQVGSQFVSSIVYDKAKELYKAGAIGELNMVEASWKRNSAIGAWQYSIPPDASPATIDWDRFLGDAPKRPFDPIRFFRWRNYWDYGTGIPGDLFVHLFAGIHHVLGSNGPTQIMSAGGLRYWKDGRDAPDVILGLYDYAKTESHPAFTLSLSTNFIDSSGSESGIQFIGSEGVMTIVEDSVKLMRRGIYHPSEKEVVEGYNSVGTFAKALQEKFAEQYRASMASNPVKPRLEGSSEYKAPEGYDDRLDHFRNFFEAIRTGKAITEDAAFGLRAAAPALLTNNSYLEKRVYGWEPEGMKIVS
ncbi:Gfo/Idh/MocA family oxidoreductase [candidate division KSB1 bacterium]|nr:Gfo/Idh/MocA family oxidoreductase [candidate division KSB1 bacterium]